MRRRTVMLFDHLVDSHVRVVPLDQVQQDLKVLQLRDARRDDAVHPIPQGRLEHIVHITVPITVAVMHVGMIRLHEHLIGFDQQKLPKTLLGERRLAVPRKTTNDINHPDPLSTYFLGKLFFSASRL